MTAITLAKAKEMLDHYLAAEVAALAGSSYAIGDRSLTRQNLKEIREGVQHWRSEVDRLSRGGFRKLLVSG